MSFTYIGNLLLKLKFTKINNNNTFRGPYGHGNVNDTELMGNFQLTLVYLI